jgi:DNA-binding SARP family transcriptional activator
VDRVGLGEAVVALWGESPPATATTKLQGHVSRPRRALGPGRLDTQTPGYVLRRASRTSSTCTAFRELIAQDRHEEALALWRGPPRRSSRAWAEASVRQFTGDLATWPV